MTKQVEEYKVEMRKRPDFYGFTRFQFTRVIVGLFIFHLPLIHSQSKTRLFEDRIRIFSSISSISTTFRGLFVYIEYIEIHKMRFIVNIKVVRGKGHKIATQTRVNFYIFCAKQTSPQLGDICRENCGCRMSCLLCESFLITLNI